MAGYPKAEGENQIRRELSRIKQGQGGGGGGMQEHDEEFHLKYIGPHDFLRDIGISDHHTHIRQSKTTAGTETYWDLAQAPVLGVDFTRDGIMQTETTHFTLSGVRITLVGDPAAAGEIWRASYEAAGS